VLFRDPCPRVAAECNVRACRCRLLSFELGFSTSSSIPIETAASHRSRGHPSCFASTSSHRDRSFIASSRGLARPKDCHLGEPCHLGKPCHLNEPCRWPNAREHRARAALRARRHSRAVVPSNEGLIAPRPHRAVCPRRSLRSQRFQAVARHSTDGALAAPANTLRV
jgi:hypothetical protein